MTDYQDKGIIMKSGNRSSMKNRKATSSLQIIIISFIIFSYSVIFLPFAFSQDNPDSGNEAALEYEETAGTEDDDLSFLSGEYNPSGNEFTFKGTVKSLFISTRAWDGTYDPVTFEREERQLYTSLNRIRISPEYRTRNLTLHLDLDGEMFFSNYMGTPAFSSLWIPDTYNELYPAMIDSSDNDNPYMKAEIHRAYCLYTAGSLTATIGRQQVRFGTGRLWNPLDLMNPLDPTAIEGPDDQRGIDAVRCDWFFDGLTEVTAVWAPGRRNDSVSEAGAGDHNYALRFKKIYGNFQPALLGGYISSRTAAGADLAVIVLGGILRGAVVAYYPEDGDPFYNSGGGYEYTFKNSLSITAEYFYNSASLNSNDELQNEYLSSIQDGQDQDSSQMLSNRFITLNRHYSGTGLGYDLHPLVRADAYLIYDFEGRGLFASFSLKINLMENLNLTAGAMAGHVFSGSDKKSDFEDLESAPLFYGSMEFYF